MRTHTIGEVLNQLKDEFDDITISKIRFLESEGLISPDRTDSGYRKFTPADIERLRYVLRAQRDRYLPLKVIKDELDRIDAGLPLDDGPAAPPTDDVAVLRGDEPTSAEGGPTVTATPVPEPSLLGEGLTDVTLSARELADAAGLELADLHALRDHGLLEDGEPYSGDDLQVARTAARLMETGLEARHLRMYRQFADREIALYEQLITPLLRQRNPESRRAATEQVDELAREGARLHRALLARELKSLLRR